MELRIDELAQRVGMTGRAIRQWQTDGLVPAPELRGRVGIYTDRHVMTIKRIQQLREQGLQLDFIRRVIDNPSGHDAGDIRQVVAGTLTPFHSLGKVTIDRADFDRDFGVATFDVLAGAGLATGDGASVTLDSALVTLLTQAAEAGLPSIAFARIVGQSQPHVRAVAESMMEMALDQVWRPFVGAGLPGTGWQDLAGSIDGLRDLAVNAQMIMFRRTLDEVLGAAIVRETKSLNAQLDPLHVDI